jgi:hypothetical protein
MNAAPKTVAVNTNLTRARKSAPAEADNASGFLTTSYAEREQND